jgi:L-fucose mutarotase
MTGRVLPFPRTDAAQPMSTGGLALAPRPLDTITHPALLASLASAGHGSRVLIADGSYPHRTACGPSADVIYLNLAPGTVDAPTVVATLAQAVAFSAVTAMAPPDGPEPEIFTTYRRLLPGLEFERLDRAAFYDSARASDVATVVATGERRGFASLLLTIGTAS